MARKAKPAPETVEPNFNDEQMAADVKALDEFALIEAKYGEERDLVNQALGQTQIALALSEFSRTIGISKLAIIKENKLYRALKGTKHRTCAEILTGTWEEFCALLGKSVDQVDRDIANLKAFGEEALESMQRIGIGYRELRQYRKLPENQKTELIEIAKTGDKDAFLDLAEEIMARSAKKEEQVAELQANYDAQSAVLKNKNHTIDDQHTALHKLKRRVETATPDEVGADLRKEASQFAFNAEAEILGSLRPAFAALTEHGINNDLAPTHEEFMVGLLAQIDRAVATLRGEFSLKLVADGDPTPLWMRPDADAVVDAELAKINVPDFVK